MTRLVGNAARSLRTFYTEYKRLYERRELLNRPWEEEFLHFAFDGRLHGHLPPPDDGRRHSVTSDGWCPGWARQSAHRADLE